MKLRYTSEQRIRSKRQFQLITRHGDFFRGRFINLWIHAAPEPQQSSCAGIIVSRKVSLRATERNRWRRRIREILRREQFSIKPGCWIVIQVKPSQPLRLFADIKSEISRLFEAASIWNQEKHD